MDKEIAESFLNICAFKIKYMSFNLVHLNMFIFITVYEKSGRGGQIFIRI